jgi:5-methylthioadenosine/S-adenosylhomocysteine deaminase
MPSWLGDARKDVSMQEATFTWKGVTLVTPDRVIPNAGLSVVRGRIASLDASGDGPALDLHGYLAFPGLINAHDHLLGTWWPRVAPNRPYKNVYEWLADYEQSPVLQERGQNEASDIYALGAYRNLIAGTTTVADHFKRLGEDGFYTQYPVHVLHEYGRTWTMRQVTAWGDDVQVEYRRAVQLGQPYIVHIAEGSDAQVAREMDPLRDRGAIGRNTLLIHGIALRPQDMALIAAQGSSVCWCPASNLFLYGRTADIGSLLRAGANVALGTDSVMTGSCNLLAELRAAREAYRARVRADPSSRWLVETVTTRAAYALLLGARRGRIAVGYEADLIVIPDRGAEPYKTLIDTRPSEIALVTRGGVPMYGDRICYDLFAQLTPAFAPVLVSGQLKLVAGDLPELLRRLSENVGRKLDFPFLPCTLPGS